MLSPNTDTAKLTDRDKFYLDILTTAIEGGIQYWATVEEYRWGIDAGIDPAAPYAVIIDTGVVPSVQHTVNLETIRKGMNLLRNGGGHHTKPGPEWWCKKWSDAYDECADDSWDFDAGDADSVVQAGLLGEVVYG